jgi:hypothetical protein
MHAATCTISTVSGLNSTVNHRNKIFPRRQKLEYRFIPLPTAVAARVPYRLHGYLAQLARLWQMGRRDVCRREMAAIMRVRTMNTIRRWDRLLEKLGILITKIRRVGKQCMTNLIKLVGFGPCGDASAPPLRDDGETPRELKNNTPPAAADSVYARQKNVMKEQDATISRLRQESHEQQGIIWSLQKALDRKKEPFRPASFPYHADVQMSEAEAESIRQGMENRRRENEAREAEKQRVREARMAEKARVYRETGVYEA